jgi:hypothetical protein
MSYMSFIRFLTRTQLLELYQVPPSLAEDFLANAPVAFHVDGEARYAEHQIDHYVHERYPCVDAADHNAEEIRNIVMFVEQMRESEQCWKDIHASYKQAFPLRPMTRHSLTTFYHRYKVVTR